MALMADSLTVPKEWLSLQLDLTPIKFHKQKKSPSPVSLPRGDQKLKLHKDPWVLKKKLTISDIDNLFRLMLKKVLVQVHVLPFMEEEQVEEMNNEAGARVEIKDLDTGLDHELTLRMWTGSRCYVLNDNWRESFVRRRKLNAGDEIWMYWDRYNLCFFFTVRGRLLNFSGNGNSSL
ncbi:PREDICTED: B3 domain-containing protein At2g33720-like [Nelumbo nucifera]|uniref:B3 domain-containing protein At2g33720-like n=2 Tax=Nelumbo nucifera TaxID=4432 RepID=A0A1U8QD07_NELNU|nr:PREDICTED: B3 domain-containing protein At2g33720-like [Nelumbo nucifera]